MAKSLDQEIQAFWETDEKDKSAAAFFSTPSNSRQFPILSEVARAVLGNFPSPANCERYFCRAEILSDKRQTPEQAIIAINQGEAYSPVRCVV